METDRQYLRRVCDWCEENDGKQYKNQTEPKPENNDVPSRWEFGYAHCITKGLDFGLKVNYMMNVITPSNR